MVSQSNPPTSRFVSLPERHQRSRPLVTFIALALAVLDSGCGADRSEKAATCSGLLGECVAASDEDMVVVDPSADPEPEMATACSGAEQLYAVENGTESAGAYVYRLAVHSIAVILHDDWLTTARTTDLVCTDGGGTYTSCAFDIDSVSAGDELYRGSAKNGTTITFTHADWASGEAALIWNYGQDDPCDATLLPYLDSGEFESEGIIFGANPDVVSSGFYDTATTSAWAKVRWLYVEDTLIDEPDCYDGIYSAAPDGAINGMADSGDDPDGDFIVWSGLLGRLSVEWESAEVCDDY